MYTHVSSFFFRDCMQKSPCKHFDASIQLILTLEEVLVLARVLPPGWGRELHGVTGKVGARAGHGPRGLLLHQSLGLVHHMLLDVALRYLLGLVVTGGLVVDGNFVERGNVVHVLVERGVVEVIEVHRRMTNYRFPVSYTTREIESSGTCDDIHGHAW